MYYELKLAFLVYLWYPKTRVRTRNTLPAVHPQKDVLAVHVLASYQISELNVVVL